MTSYKLCRHEVVAYPSLKAGNLLLQMEVAGILPLDAFVVVLSVAMCTLAKVWDEAFAVVLRL
jgi:hypothetical protein